MRYLTATRTVFSGLFCCTVIAAAIVVGPLSAKAQEGQFAGSYITPFPQGDVYRVRIVGDYLAKNLLPALAGQIGRDRRLVINQKAYWFDRVIRTTFPQKLAELEQTLAAENTDIAVIMMGPGDRRSVRVKGRKHWPGDDVWRREYSRRIDLVMKALKRKKIAVYWIGIPVLRKSGANTDAQLMNEVIRERAYINGLKYIESYTRFLDAEGRYNSYGPDLTGKIRLLRERDGVHLTSAGSQKLAHFIERDLKRDVKLAREERAVPLAGGPREQERIRQAISKSAARSAAADPTWSTQVNSDDRQNAAGNGVQSKPQGGYFGGNGGEQKADHSKVEVKTRDANGQLKNLKFEILRPAIPSSVVALVTRKQSRNRAAQLGEKLIGQLVGGLNVISTVSPSNAGGGAEQKRKLSPAQTPFFRVLVRGERVAPKPGRADDLSWPRDPNAVGPAADARGLPERAIR